MRPGTSSSRAAYEAALDAEITAPPFFQDPYPTYRRLRETAPVHWCAPWNQWLVTRHVDVLAVLHDPAHFSSSGWEQRYLAHLPPGARERLPHLWRHYTTPVLSNTDPPAHTRLRQLVAASFTPRLIEGLRPRVEALVEELLDRAEEAGRFDAIADFAYPLPAIVIAELLGAPVEDREQFTRWSADIIAFVGSGRVDLERADRADRTISEFQRYLAAVIAERRRTPRDDLLSLLIAASVGEAPLSEDELVATCITLLFAGHETTANLIGNGLLALLHHPAQLAALRAQPTLAPAAVEEMLRYDGPVQRVRRVATADLELGGRQIRAGELVMAFLGSANRDPEAFADPDRFDIARPAPRHLAFGHGIHFCVGATLARLEAPIALRAIVSRFPGLRLQEGAAPCFKPNMTFRGLASLPLALA